ncbi:cyclic AMP-responsive element-binding protein 3-like protein 3-B [Lates japonicus]|uniref:Cyclic AMP-responsive element-binding protein 3-like protein 3-B n=1 Tax=Lates japonicus TaxID=270547 RepID=A0AAD3MS21_LATJO|nr:cyclic AMP-responsive element-binding protein 3-like protein 3-B [Lates japonicus]
MPACVAQVARGGNMLIVWKEAALLKLIFVSDLGSVGQETYYSVIASSTKEQLDHSELQLEAGDQAEAEQGGMSACSAHNLELQRKIQQLEETNNALLEQLNWLQALLPNSSRKTTHRGTCILPDPYSQLSQGEYTETKVPSRSLQSMDEVRDVPLPPPPFLSVSRGFEVLFSPSLKLWPWTNFPTVDFQSSHHQDHRHRDDH